MEKEATAPAKTLSQVLAGVREELVRILAQETGKGTEQVVGSTISKCSSVQFSHSVVSDSLQPHESQHARPVSSLKLTSIELVMPSSHLILCRPLPPIPPSIRVFSNESTLRMRWPKYWSFSFRIIPSKEVPGLISFRMDWLDLLALQGTLKSLLQHHSSKASILRCSAFFTVQLSHPYMTTGKTIALTIRTLLGKVMSLLLNMLSRLVITFLPRSKRKDQTVLTHYKKQLQQPALSSHKKGKLIKTENLSTISALLQSNRKKKNPVEKSMTSFPSISGKR